MRELPNRRTVSVIFILVLVLILFIVLWIAGRNFAYFFTRVNQNEVGIQFRGGKIYNVVGPGVYSDVGLFVEMKHVSSQAVPFSVEDPEIITSDKQRIGLVVSGDIFRPNLAQKDKILSFWDKYSTLYLDNAIIINRVEALARQAMKVCVGSRKFDDSIIGTARDALRACIDDELSLLADNYGLEIQNVTVPNVELSTEVQTALDSIVQSRLATEKAAQDKLKADAQALAEQARQEGEIRVAQGRLQEETRQKTILAKLEQEKLQAEKAVIEAQKSNDLLSAQQDLAINKALALAAAEKAKSDLAKDVALGELYAKYDGYLQLQIALANASALKLTDKIIFTLEGMMPNLVIPGPGITPTVDAGNTNP
jgi:hypothetical protein